MAYQAKLIEEGSWRIFAEPFHCFHIHIKMWWSIDYSQRIEWVYLMAYQTKLIEESLWCIFAKPFHYFHIHIKMLWSMTIMKDRMSISNCLSSQTHWRRFVTHLCRTFPLFPYSYLDVLIDRLPWRIEWVHLMAYQTKLIEESSWCIFVEPFQCFHIHINVWWPNEYQRRHHEEG